LGETRPYAALDFVVSVFAPKNFAETARVLRLGGWLALACPGPNHFAELRHRSPMLRRHEHKARDYAGSVARLIGPPRLVRLVDRPTLDPEAVCDAILMRPNAGHIAAPVFVAPTEPIEVTLDIELLLGPELAGRGSRPLRRPPGRL
jgi:23S rRNA (guanine745-N1)-methyltransferase